MELLKEGDIIEIVKGNKIYVTIPNHFIYENCRGVFDELSTTDIKVGEQRNGLDTNIFKGKYIVTKTTYDGGCVYIYSPGGHHVWCKSVDSDIVISFYQTGSFTAMIKDIKPIGRATCKWEIL